ncbi:MULTISPECIES: proteasome assembly chaperone family protein [unclassified Pseudactinotalea]|uniref:proteasome assembly chaperone family protein n=1 Tax=unclassified Pseudactinotalea TaxID=2649176 RepID=UPI00128E26F5|nr:MULTISPECIES: PAC2 family protein [unclassified Pseudactinotalea]MPV49536.1 PAC2 family protein [Pseudactinotalea sp. HY160]QGH69845.1 PAC2 family protein [Pseudactinotalea sp. HY158]
MSNPRNPRDLFVRSEEPAEAVAVLVHAFQGAFDAGQAGQQAADHLTATLGGERVATFRVDELLDYRSRRPAMMFENGAFTDYDRPELVVDLLRDDEGEPLLLLHGPEPDLQWDSFVDAVEAIVDDFGVRLTIGMHGIPMGVPHTRPLTVTAHATRRDLIADHPNFIGSVQVPASVSALLEYELGRRGRDALGISVNVPHYLAQTEFPQAAAELLRQVSRAGDLSLPLGDLEAEGVRVLEEIDRQVGESAEVSGVVHALERNYDEHAQRAVAEGRHPLPAPVDVPSADDIAAQVEAFLAGHESETDSGDEFGPQGPAAE